MSIRGFVNKVLHPNTYSSEAYVAWLRGQGVDVGDGCKLFAPASNIIDTQRPHMLHIGDYVKITADVVILTHDYSRSTMFQASGRHIADCGVTSIGDNTFIGIRATILMGAHIGSNCIVGAGAVVSGRFDDGLVIGGNPARAICTVEELCDKRSQREIPAAVEYVNRFFQKCGRYPEIREMTNAFSWLYLPHTQRTIDEYPDLFCLSGIDLDIYNRAFLNSEPVWPSFEAFIEYCKTASSAIEE